MSVGYLSTTRTVRFGRMRQAQAASELFSVAAFSSLGLIASLLFVASGGQIGF